MFSEFCNRGSSRLCVKWNVYIISGISELNYLISCLINCECCISGRKNSGSCKCVSSLI